MANGDKDNWEQYAVKTQPTPVKDDWEQYAVKPSDKGTSQPHPQSVNEAISEDDRQRGIEQPDKSVGDRLAVPKEEPNHKDAYSFYNQYQEEKKQREAAPSQEEKYMANLEKTTPTPKSPEQKQIDPLVEKLQKNPKDSKTANDLGAVYLSQNKTDEARQTFTQNIINNPDDAASRVGLAHIDNSKGDYKEAIKGLDTAIQLSPTNAKAWTERAFAKSKMGDTQGALKDVSMAEHLDPSNPYHNSLKSAILAKTGDQANAHAERVKSIDKQEKIDYQTPEGAAVPLSGSKNMPFGLPTESDQQEYEKTLPPEVQAYNENLRQFTKFGDWLESGGVKNSEDYSSKLLGFMLNPIGALATTGLEQEKAGVKNIGEGTKGIGEKGLNAADSFKVLGGIADMAFGAVSATEGGAKFIGGLAAAPAPVQQLVTAPLQTIFDPQSETGKQAAKLGDIVAQLFTIHALNSGADDIYNIAKKKLSGQDLTSQESTKLQGEVGKITPEDIKNTQDILGGLPPDMPQKQVNRVVPMIADMMKAKKFSETVNPDVKFLYEQKAKDLQDEVTNQLKPKTDAVPIRSAEEIPLGKPSEDSGEVGKGVPKSEETPAPQKEKEVTPAQEELRADIKTVQPFVEYKGEKFYGADHDEAIAKIKDKYPDAVIDKGAEGQFEITTKEGKTFDVTRQESDEHYGIPTSKDIPDNLKAEQLPAEKVEEPVKSETDGKEKSESDEAKKRK